MDCRSLFEKYDGIESYSIIESFSTFGAKDIVDRSPALARFVAYFFHHGSQPCYGKRSAGKLVVVGLEQGFI